MSASTVTYAVGEGETFTSGQKVEIKDDGGAVVATLVYGEAGGADFKESQADGHVDGFSAYTPGNGVNGNKEGGTFYTITPSFDGNIDVAVVLNASKSFYILENGTALEGYDGIQTDDKYYGTYSFSVKGGSNYKIYCAGSNLGFYGFTYTFTGGDTQDPIAFMEDYADFAPIYLNSGKYEVKSEKIEEGVTYTLIEGVDSHYESLFSYNPPYKHEAIRESSAGDVVRCLCLIGYAENGTGFAVAVALHGSADNDECLYSANKILDEVTFVPAECNIDSTDLWLHEVGH